MQADALEELRRLSEAATPGPWTLTEKRGKRDGYVRAGDRTVVDARYRNGEADAAFIVACERYVRSLLEDPSDAG